MVNLYLKLMLLLLTARRNINTLTYLRMSSIQYSLHTTLFTSLFSYSFIIFFSKILIFSFVLLFTPAQHHINTHRHTALTLLLSYFSLPYTVHSFSMDNASLTTCCDFAVLNKYY